MLELLTRKQLAQRFGVCQKTIERRTMELETKGLITPEIQDGPGCINYAYKADEVLPLLEKMETEKGWMRGSNRWKSLKGKRWPTV